MELRSTPTLRCSACGTEIEGAGYLPALERDDGYEPLADAAVCGACGYNEVGMMGCAPELGDLIDPDAADALLFVRVAADGVDVVSAK
jgi:hypothetical protein